MNIDIVDIDTTTAKDGNQVYGGRQALSEDTDDVEPIHADGFQCLGVYAACAPATKDGNCEGVKIGGIGSTNEVLVGARDTRVGKKLGKMDPGDTILLGTDPDTDVQVRCHGKRKQVVILARKGDAASEMAMVMLDAGKEKFQFLGFGGTMEFSKSGGWKFLDGTGAGMFISGGTVSFNAKVNLTGNPAALPVLTSLTPVAGITGVGKPALGVFARLGAWLDSLWSPVVA